MARILIEPGTVYELAQLLQSGRNELLEAVRIVEDSLAGMQWESSLRGPIMQTWEREKSALQALAERSEMIGTGIRERAALLERVDRECSADLAKIQPMAESLRRATDRFFFTPEEDAVFQKAIEEARERFAAAQARVEELDAQLDAAYVRASGSYRRLKLTKGTERFQEIEASLDEVLGMMNLDSSGAGPALKTRIAIGDAAVHSFAKHYLTENFHHFVEVVYGELAGKIFTVLGSSFAAWNIGWEGAKALTLVVRNLETQWHTWVEMFPVTLQLDHALDDMYAARDTLEALTDHQ